MRTKILVLLTAAAMLLVGISVIGSNMGFKISIPVYKYVAGSHTGLNWVSLPYYVGYTTASTVWTDIAAIPNVSTVELSQYQEASGGPYPINTYAIYDNDTFTDDFTITSGGQLANASAVLVKITTTSGTSVNWVVVGSHSPSMSVPLYAYAAGSHTGLNWKAIPYHTTGATASALWTEINAVTPNTATVELSQYQEASGGPFPINTYAIYDNDTFTDNFTVTPGSPVLIKVSATKTWTPAHY
jgi:hypothetical protein